MVRASNRKGFVALSVCGGGGGGAADLELDPELRALTFSLVEKDEDLTSGPLGWVEPVDDIGSTTKSRSTYRWQNLRL